MQSGSSRQHTRRRSARRPITTDAGRNNREGEQEEVRWLLEEDAWSEEDGKSSSDNGYSGRSDDDHDDEETGLTGARGKKSRRRRDSRLDRRIVKDSEITSEEKKEADQSVIKNMLINGMFIGLWLVNLGLFSLYSELTRRNRYIFSLSISIYNKWMFSRENLDFRFPLFTTCMHMLVQFSLASLVLWIFPKFRPRADSLSHPSSVYTAEEQRRHDLDASEHKPLMTKMFYLTRLGPCGIATGLDIGLGNMSLQFITLTFYSMPSLTIPVSDLSQLTKSLAMCKSSSLAFVLLFAFLFRLESPSYKLVAIIATMTFGVVMMVSGEVDFSPLGFMLVISAAFFSGFRWALTQILLLRNPATSNPFSSIFFLAPIMFTTLFIIACGVEGPIELLGGMGELMDKKGHEIGRAHV